VSTDTCLSYDTLFGRVNVVDTAIARLREFEPEEGYYLAFSGGKDSCVILALAKAAGVRFDAHYALTTVDPPELVRFIRDTHPEVAIHRPPKTMWQLIVDHGTPPTRLMRYCCRELKETGGAGRVVVTGIRWQESGRRRQRRMVETCRASASKTYLHPIIDWTGEKVWAYIREQGIPYCSLYDEGFERLGCVLCPMSRQVERDTTRWPKIARAYQRAIRKAWERRTARGDTMQWESGEAMYRWWIDRNAGDTRKDSEPVLFDDDGMI